MPGVRVVLNWILTHADAGQAGLVERRMIRTAEPARARCNGADYAVVFERAEYLAHDVGCIRWSKHRSATHTPGTRVDVEIPTKFFVPRFWIFE